MINLYTTTAAGRHWATLSDSERTKAVFWHNILTAPSVLGLGLPKLTVVSLLTRVFNPGQLHQTFLWVSAILCVVNFIVVILMAWLPCRPVSAAWDVSITVKKCLNSWIYVDFCYYATSEPRFEFFWSTTTQMLIGCSSFLRRPRSVLGIVSSFCFPQAWMEYSKEVGAVWSHGTWYLVRPRFQIQGLFD